MGLFDAIASTLNTGLQMYAGRRAQSAQQAQASAQMQYNRENLLQSQMFNSAQAAVDRDWTASQADTARNWTAEQAGIERQYNAQQAALNRDFQERMSNTQYQRATADMMAAGINPMLAISQGGAGNVSGDSASTHAPSASAPGGASASSGPGAPAPSMDFKNYIGSALTSGLNAYQTLTQARNVDAMTETQKAQTLNVLADTQLKAANENLSNAQSRDLQNKIKEFDFGWDQGITQRSISNKADVLGAEAGASVYKPALASEEWKQQHLITDYLGLEGPRRVGENEFQQMLNDLLKGGAHSAAGAGDIMKMLLPIILKAMSPAPTTVIRR